MYKDVGMAMPKAIEMKGTKVLTLGAGREVLPHNMAVDADDIYTHPLAIRIRYMCIYACAVLLIGGRAGPFYRFTVYQLADSRSQGSTTTR